MKFPERRRRDVVIANQAPQHARVNVLHVMGWKRLLREAHNRSWMSYDSSRGQCANRRIIAPLYRTR